MQVYNKNMNLDRINELARKQRTIGLTEEEKEEQAILRKEYIEEFRASFKQQLENTYVQDKDGNKIPVKEYNSKHK